MMYSISNVACTAMLLLVVAVVGSQAMPVNSTNMTNSDVAPQNVFGLQLYCSETLQQFNRSVLGEDKLLYLCELDSLKEQILSLCVDDDKTLMKDALVLSITNIIGTNTNIDCKDYSVSVLHKNSIVVAASQAIRC